MKVLAIDYGAVRLGLAVGETDTKLVLPYGVLPRAADEQLVEQLRQIVDEEGIGTIVVGDPVALAGHSGKQSQDSRLFAALVRQQLSLPVALVDERLTSVRADLARQDSRRTRDELAAMFILQDYLERSGVNSENKEL